MFCVSTTFTNVLMRFLVLSSCFLTSLYSDPLESSSSVGRPKSSFVDLLIPKRAKNLREKQREKEKRKTRNNKEKITLTTACYAFICNLAGNIITYNPGQSLGNIFICVCFKGFCQFTRAQPLFPSNNLRPCIQTFPGEFQHCMGWEREEVRKQFWKKTRCFMRAPRNCRNYEN